MKDAAKLMTNLPPSGPRRTPATPSIPNPATRSDLTPCCCSAACGCHLPRFALRPAAAGRTPTPPTPAPRATSPSPGDLVTLHVDGIRYLEKAPLPYWLRRPQLPDLRLQCLRRAPAAGHRRPAAGPVRLPLVAPGLRRPHRLVHRVRCPDPASESSSSPASSSPRSSSHACSA